MVQEDDQFDPTYAVVVDYDEVQAYTCPASCAVSSVSHVVCYNLLQCVTVCYVCKSMYVKECVTVCDSIQCCCMHVCAS